MNRIITPEGYYILLLLCFVFYTIVFMIFRNKDKISGNKLLRWNLILAFPTLALIFTVGKVMQPVTAFSPAILASSIFWYITFVKYPPINSKP